MQAAARAEAARLHGQVQALEGQLQQVLAALQQQPQQRWRQHYSSSRSSDVVAGLNSAAGVEMQVDCCNVCSSYLNGVLLSAESHACFITKHQLSCDDIVACIRELLSHHAGTGHASLVLWQEQKQAGSSTKVIFQTYIDVAAICGLETHVPLINYERAVTGHAVPRVDAKSFTSE